MKMVSPLLLIIAFVITFISSWIGSTVGGGGLLATPVLLHFGLPVPVILGTRRFSTLGGTITSMIQFHKWGKVDYKLASYFIIVSLIGGVVGFSIIDSLDQNIMKKMVGVMIIGLLIFFIFENNKKVQKLKGHLLKRRKILGPIAGLFAAIVTVIVGGGGAILLSYVLIIMYGQTILQASGTRKLPLLATSLISLALFIYKGYINWVLAFVMLIAHALGGWFGSKYHLEKGEEKIKLIFYIIAFIMAVSLFIF